MDNRIHVLQCTSRLVAGGVQSFLMNYAENIDCEKIVFDYLVQDTGTDYIEERVLSSGSSIYQVTPITAGKIKYMREVYRTLKEHPEISIVHAHLNFLNCFPLLAAMFAGVRVRISHSHSNYPAKGVFKTVLRKVLQIIAPLFTTDYWACSTLAAEWLHGKQRVSRGQTRIIHNAIETRKYLFDCTIRSKIRSELGVSAQKLFIHVGMFGEAKNHLFLLRLFSEYLKTDPLAVLVLCGDGPKRGNIETTINRCHLENNVILKGMVHNANEYLIAADIMIYPSVYEGLPLACVEAQAAGCTCIVSQAIPSEALFAENVFQCSSFETAEWLDTLKAADQVQIDRYRGVDLCLKAHYDIAEESKILQALYIEKKDREYA